MPALSLSLQIVGALGVFLYGLTVMSEGLQKASANSLRSILEKATENRFVGTLSGFLVTCAVQSSSVTTVMVVAFCSAQLLTLGQSLGIIFGANIGTTTTAWLVSLLGFKVKIAAFAVPLIGIGFFSRFIKRWSLPHKVGQAMVGFGLLFLGLQLLKDAIPDVKNSPGVMEWIARIEPNSLVGILSAILFGALITLIVQSSSAAMAITLTAAAKGYIDFPTACAITLGENIGTTVTASLASIGAPLTARRAALGHFLFNFLGAIWPVILFKPLLSFVDWIVPGDVYDATGAVILVAIPVHIAAFHTSFNVINTTLFLPLIRPLEKLIVRILPDQFDEVDQQIEHELVYMTTPFGSAPELAISGARKEVDRMAGITIKMIARINQAFRVNGKERERLLLKIRNHERATDILEHKIGEYLAAVVHGQLSSAASKTALSLMSMINDLERIGDHGEKVSFLLAKEGDRKSRFSEAVIEELSEMALLTDQNLRAMRELILNPEEDPMPAALQREDELNAMRDKLRRSYLKRMEDGSFDAPSGVIFIDIATSFEKMGDHSYNVIEATAGLK
jgi:phosphate:Na+ symporter